VCGFKKCSGGNAVFFAALLALVPLATFDYIRAFMAAMTAHRFPVCPTQVGEVFTGCLLVVKVLYEFDKIIEI